MWLLGPGSTTIPSIILVGAVTIVLLASILFVAGRRGSYATATLPLLAVGWSAVALASLFALRTLGRTMTELYAAGGGIRDLSLGIWQASRLPLASAWIAAAVTLLALGVALLSARGESESSGPSRTWWSGGVAVAAGVVAVLAFRGTVAFILDAVVPGRQPAWLEGRSIGEAISISIVAAGLASALAFVIALALAVVTFRHGVAPRRAVVALLVVSLVASAVLVESLRSYSSRFRGTAIEGRPIASR